MLIDGASPKPEATDIIKDVTEADFVAEVIEKSMDVPVVVDFWAPWCGPCKTLGPQLEAAVAAHKGRVRMVKVNVDENQMIAGELRVQSIPTVYAFFQGRPVDAFQGAVPQSQIKQFVDKLAALSGDDGGLGDALAAAEAMLDEGAVSDAIETFAAIIGEEPENADAWGGLLRSHLAANDDAAAASALQQVPAAIAHSSQIEAARARLQLAEQAKDAGPLAELQARVDEAPQDQPARLELARALYAAGEIAAAVELLLESFRLDREWNEGAVKAQLLTIFDSLPPGDEIAQKGRRRLSSLIFA